MPDDVHQRRYQSDLEYKRKTNEIYAQAYRFFSSGNTASLRSDSTTFFIPVVVHIMHLPQDSVPSDLTSNITDQRVHQAIAYLNQAFQDAEPYAGGPYYSNAGTPSVNTKIEFCLAVVDTNGNSTTGINRYPTELSNLKRDEFCSQGGTNDECLKSYSFWNSRDYLNIWLVNEICDNSASNNCGIPGYAYQAGAHGKSYDGAVIDVEYFGADPGGNTVVVHQIGHYLGLLNTYDFGCKNGDCLNDGDQICDTPPDAYIETLFCTDGDTINSCSSDANDTTGNNPFHSDVQDNYENYMDYGNWECKNNFTLGQKERMRFTLISTRKSLLESNGCFSAYTNIKVNRILNPKAIACGPPFAPKVEIINDGNVPVNSFQLAQRINANAPIISTINQTLQPGDSIVVTLVNEVLLAGTHILKIKVASVNGTMGDANETDNELSRSFVYVNTINRVTQFPYCKNFEDLSTPLDWTIGDFDKKVSYDFMEEPGCTSKGSNMLRYNTFGMFTNNNVIAGIKGTRDALISPVFDLRNASSATLSFDVAFQTMGPDNELRLQVSVSDDCESGFTTLFDKRNQQLQTTQTPFNGSVWIPQNCYDWRTETINLDDWVGRDIFIAFDILLNSYYSQNLYIDNICLDVTFGCDAPHQIPTREGIFVADKMCTDSLNWTHYWSSADNNIENRDLLILSVKDTDLSGVNLKPEEVSVTITSGFQKGGHDLTDLAPYVNNPTGWYVMGRYFQTNPSKQPDDSLEVRFYYAKEDYLDMELAAGSQNLKNIGNLVFYTLAPDADPNPLNGHVLVTESQYIEYRNLGVSSLPGWVLGEEENYFSATFKVQELGSGGGGTGGEGLSNGATYPISLQLTGIQEFDEVNLSWETPLEINVGYYEIYHSGNGNKFTMLESKFGNGRISTDAIYSYLDTEPHEGINYYYVKQIHENGLEILSDTIEVYFDNTNLVRVYPNPFQSDLKIKLASISKAPIQLSLYNGAWQELTRHIWMQEDDFAHEISIDNVPPGIYFYVVIYKGKTFRGKIVKNQ
ncbi:MAG: zinc-dependent metalloprotease [Bacteroidetes bacterium]|nr:zinc-dependent metalloprotease [Bacteroidota bacterium]